MGGVRVSIERAWTGDVWVRRTLPEPSDASSSDPLTQKVSCIVRAGWSGPRFIASKLSHSASTSGPSATSQPIATKMSATSSWIVVMGCRAPTTSRSVGSVTSTVSAASRAADSTASSSSVRAAIARVTSPRA